MVSNNYGNKCRQAADGKVLCWACGVVCTPPLGPRWSERSGGWVSRKTVVMQTHKETEVYCPQCFAEWGWPPETPYYHSAEESNVGVTESDKLAAKRRRNPAPRRRPHRVHMP